MTIHTKLLAARETMGHFEKSGTHQQKYKYYKGEEVLEQVGDTLAANGILFLPCQVDAQITTGEEIGKDGQVKTVEHALVRFDMTFVDGETGETLVVPTYGSARDYGDKALFKAQTLAIKYLFLRMFLKGEGVDEESEADSIPPASRPASPPRLATPSRTTPAPDFEGHARQAQKPPATPTGSSDSNSHWSTPGSEARANFDRAMSYNKIEEATIKVALDSEDPAISIDQMLLQIDSVGAAISTVLTHVQGRAATV